jgi:hypothetical protein
MYHLKNYEKEEMVVHKIPKFTLLGSCIDMEAALSTSSIRGSWCFVRRILFSV